MGQQIGTSLSDIAFVAMLSRHCRLSASYRRESDRRITCRFQVEERMVPATIRGVNWVTRGFLINISSSGAQFVVEQPARSDGEVGLSFLVGTDAYRQRAKVVRDAMAHGRRVLTVHFEPGPFERVSSAV